MDFRTFSQATATTDKNRTGSLSEGVQVPEVDMSYTTPCRSGSSTILGFVMQTTAKLLLSINKQVESLALDGADGIIHQ